MPSTADLPWLNPALPARERAQLLVAAMSLEQKIAQLHGSMATIDIYGFDAAAFGEMSPEEQEQLLAQLRIQRHVVGIDELGIPRFRITNGPVGVGMGDGHPSPPATALPMTIGLAAGFDANLAHDYGDIIGSETATLGQHVLEGPGLCLHRTPIAGRNFEYFSEDPYLTGVMGVEVTKAIQAHGVIAMAKHFVVNDQEFERFRANVEIDEQTLRELYLLPFEMVVKDADLAAIMSSYNRIRGTYATENRYTLTDVLRREWGFEGYVQSDFWSCRSCAASLSAGMDHEMPDGKWLNEDNVKAALHDTSLEIETVNRALIRRYTQMFRLGQFDRPYAPGVIDADAHGAVSRRIGQQCAVLLHNDGLLPLDAHALGSILIVGQAPFTAMACNGGGGSSKVTPLYTVAPLDGFRDVLAGLGAGTEASTFIVDDDLANLADAVEAARGADAVVVLAGIVASEGADLVTPSLPWRQDEMIEALLAANPETVVVLKDSTPILMPWIERARGVLEAWNQGSEDGHVVADLVLGVVNPSGKVPTTYMRSIEDSLYAGRPERYPGVDEGDGFPTMRYSERLAVGYRWFDSAGIEPLFCFGHGLSYTTFELSDAHLTPSRWDGQSPVEVSVTVKNTGARAGAEVVQVYLGVPASGQPPKRLVGFAKVELESGESRRATIAIDPAASHHPLSVWDKGSDRFVVPTGEFVVHLGTSSRNTMAIGTLTKS